MCDTIVVVHANRVLFGKNSDRDANEGQNLVWTPARSNDPNVALKCTYIEIPDVQETYATLISQPFWMWGAEIGTNEKGVTIGNEAVFTKSPYEKEPGLIGMDLLRLALERAATAEEAVEVITALLREYGQGGGCGHENRKFAYHNSFIIADPTSAFVLETAGRDYAVEAVSGARTISNGLTIPEFNEKNSDFINTTGSGCRIRQKRTQALANDAVSIDDIIAILQDHGEDHEFPHYTMLNGGLTAPCVHASGIAAASQTTASWVAELSPDNHLHWATATAAPCTSLYKPVAVDTPMDLQTATDEANESLWWRHEAFHRAVIQNPAEMQSIYQKERNSVQRKWLTSPPTSAEAFKEADKLLEEWTTRAKVQPTIDIRPSWVRRYWTKRNSRARLTI